MQTYGAVSKPPSDVSHPGEWEKYVVNNEREDQRSFVVRSIINCLVFGLGGGLLWQKWKASELDADDYGPQL